jgi:hypothetical protein
LEAKKHKRFKKLVAMTLDVETQADLRFSFFFLLASESDPFYSGDDDDFCVNAHSPNPSPSPTPFFSSPLPPQFRKS